MKVKDFEITDEFPNGSSLKGYITANYFELVEAFGEPQESDGYKVSGEWTFKNKEGEFFTIYDWKSTNLYDPDYHSVEQFRNLSSAEFNVGGTTNADNFIEWLRGRVGIKSYGVVR